MPEVRVTLGFSCCGCGHPVEATVQCTGDALESKIAAPVAAVNVPCPTCGHVCQLLFEPDGTVRAVRPFAPQGRLPKPSLN